MNKKTKKYALSQNHKSKIIACIAIIFAIACLTIIFILNYIDVNAAVAYVNGELISYRELKHSMEKNRTNTIYYIEKEYGISFNHGFWDIQLEDRTLTQFARDLALERIVEDKIQLILAREHGLINDISYEAIMEDKIAENLRREEENERGGVLFGPIIYTENVFYDHFMSNLIYELKEILKQNKLKSSEQEQRNYYEENINLFSIQDTIKIDRIYIKYLDDEGVDEEKSKLSKILMNEVMDMLTLGKSINDVKKLFTSQIEIESIEFAPSRSRVDAIDNSYNEVYLYAINMNPSDISPIIDTEGTLNIIICSERIDGGYVPFEQVKNIVSTLMLDIKYNELVKTLISEAEVEFVKHTLSKVKIE